jgi:porin
MMRVARDLSACLILAVAPAGAQAQTASQGVRQDTGQPVGTEDAAVTKGAAVARQPVAPHPHDTLTGDWGGLRTRLRDGGVSIRADYVSETFSAVRGGQRRGTAYVQQLRGGIDLDLGTVAGWSGALFHLTFNDRRGTGISSDFVGNRLPIQEAAGGFYARLSEFSLEQNLVGGKLNLRLGYFAMGNDLGGMALGCNLVNAAFCAHPLSLSGNSGWYNYPNARWGAAVRYRLRPDLAIRTGLYQVNPRLNEEHNAFRPFAGGTTGVLLPLEVEYDPGAAEGSRLLPGHYKLGAYYDTSSAARQAEVSTVGGRYGVYLLADQMILQEGRDGRGLSIFGQVTASPKASAQIMRWYAGGLVKTGTFRGRDADTIALGIAHAQVNPRLRQAYVDTVSLGDGPGGFASLPVGETAIELSYGLQLTKWLSLRPDVQYIIDPGAFSSKRVNDALAVGGQIKAQF